MLRPLHDQIDYENALEILAAMAGHALNPDQEDYFDTLSLLVEAYETVHFPAPPAQDGLSVLKHLLKENDMSAADLARMLGADRSLGVRILNGERKLTVEHIKKLVARFRLPADLFLA